MEIPIPSLFIVRNRKSKAYRTLCNIAVVTELYKDWAWYEKRFDKATRTRGTLLAQVCTSIIPYLFEANIREVPEKREF